MIEKKTGVLYGASAGMGALLAGAAPSVVAALDEFGRLTGMGFQLQDDVIDLITPEKVSGKRQGGDLIEAKKTLIMIHAFANDVPVKVFGKKDATPEQIQEAISLLEKSGSHRVRPIPGGGDGAEGQAGSAGSAGLKGKSHATGTGRLHGQETVLGVIHYAQP